MPNASTTQASSASDTSGQPIPLSYGYVWATGKRAEYYQLQDTGNSWLDYTRVGIWLLGHGEWDGCTELWINDHLTWRGYNPGPAVPYFSGQQWQVGLDNKWNFVFNFHSGTDADIGSGFAATSKGPDQGVDVLFKQFPPAIQPLHYSRIAYYAIMRKQPIDNQTNDHRDDPSQWTDINPIGLWRALKCRLFDANGNMTGYAFTTNPVWHWVDVRLRRKIFPEFNISQSAGIDDISGAARACFDWNKIYSSAQYCDEILSNGRRRFQGSYAFTQATSLQAIEAQIALVCRAYYSSYGGKYAINCDKPRSSVFTFKRDHVLPGSFEATDRSVHTAGNRYIANFRDLLVPQAAVIASISNPSNGRPVVTTQEPHPFNAGDWIAIGGTDTVYDGEWQVYSVPAVSGVGTTSETYPSTFVMNRKGSNYPSSVGSGGSVGLLYSRFKERAPEFWHKNNMLARGAVGLGIPRLRNKSTSKLDLATSTYDQASRIARYERDRSLGVDAAPYVTPPFVKLRTSMFAMDDVGNLACGIEPGDHVTIDATLSVPYAGEYEVLDPKTIYPPTIEAGGKDGSLMLQPSQSSGEIEFALGPYNESIMYDDSDSAAAGWPSVPGSDPGNDSNFTGIDLADGTMVFFTGQQASGTQFQLPSSGFPPGNLMAWASAAGTNVSGHSMRVIQICDADASRNLKLTYTDDIGDFWSGDVGYAALSWLSPEVPTVSGSMKWLELTLLGGETILWGYGVLAHGASVALPAGYSFTKSFAVAYVHDTPTTATHNPRIVGASVDPASGLVSCTYNDGAGNLWHGNAAVLVFAWKNNGGTVVTETVVNTKWMEVTLTNGKKFGVGCALNIPDGTAVHLPSAAGAGTTLQGIAGTSTFVVPSGAGHTWGVDEAYLDASNVVHVQFGEGSGDNPTVPGVGDVFMVYCESGSAAPTLVTISPLSATIAAGTTQPFSATVTGNSNPNVTWSVDGIPGGNLTVGTINSSGLYSAPNAAGTHTVTATSVGDPTASSSATVNVYGAVLTGNLLTEDDGTIIYTDGGDTILVG